MSWRQTLKAARQRRQAIIDDVRRNGWPGMRKAVGEKAVKVRRVVSQASKDAYQSGAKLAQRVVSVQQSAKLPAKVAARSARSVAGDREHSRNHAEWQKGYTAKVRELTPGALPKAAPEPAWYELAGKYEPNGPDIEPEL